VIIYPAIDLLEGHVVRLEQGRRESAVTFATDPLEVVTRWADAGAKWLHVVDLDRAFGAGAGNREAIRRIVEAATARGVKVQVGGGLRSPADVLEVVATGAERVVIGTVAAADPTAVTPLIHLYGERLVVALDAIDGEVVMRGWTEGTGRRLLDLGRELAALGIKHFLYTDVSRDGVGGGPDIRSAAALARETGCDVIASGGVGVIGHVAMARAAGASGLVIGRALYEEKVNLGAAIALAGPQE